MLFVRGMYWEEREPVTERIRIRVVSALVVWERVVGFIVVVVLAVGSRVGFFVVEEEEARRAFVYVRARVRAPERETEGVFVGEGGEVERRVVRDVRRVDWTSRNGR